MEWGHYCRSFISGLQWLGNCHRDGLTIFDLWFLSAVQTISCQSKIQCTRRKAPITLRIMVPSESFDWYPDDISFTLFPPCFHQLLEGYVPQYWAKSTSSTHSVVIERLAVMLNKTKQSMASMLVYPDLLMQEAWVISCYAQLRSPSLQGSLSRRCAAARLDRDVFERIGGEWNWRNVNTQWLN